MKLNFEQIKSITQGASRIENKNSYISFYRFSKEEEEMYSKTEFYAKTFSTAGIQMEFKTDGDALDLQIITKHATSRTYFSLDIFVNDKYIGSCKNFDTICKDVDYTTKEFHLGEFCGNYRLGASDKKVRLVFPWSVATEVINIELANATYITPVKKEKKIIAYGDSITNGYDATYSSNAYAVQIANLLGAEIYNKAIGGEVFVPELVKKKGEITPDYIMAAYGSNDWSLKEQDDFKIRCSSFFDALANNYPETKIFAITPIWRADYKGERKFGAFEEVEAYIRHVCSQYKNIEVISGWEFVPHNEKYFADFRLHPNDDGFKYYAENLYLKLKSNM